MKTVVRTIFCVSFAAIFVAVSSIEGGGFTLGQGAAIGLIGAIGSLATMKETGWFCE